MGIPQTTMKTSAGITMNHSIRNEKKPAVLSLIIKDLPPQKPSIEFSLDQQHL